MSQSNHSDNDLLELLRECSSGEGECRPQDIHELGEGAPVTAVIEAFGSWSEALEAAGLDDEIEDSMKQYSDNDIRAMLWMCVEQRGKCSPRDFRELDNTCSVSNVMRRFSSWSDAKEGAGIEEDLSSLTGRQQQYADEQILSHLKELERCDGENCEHSGVTTEHLQEHDDLVGQTVVIERFGPEDEDAEIGGWLRAKQKAGIESDERSKNSRPREHTDKDYLEMLCECEEKYGKVTQRLFDQKEEYPSSGAIRKRFETEDEDIGGWRRAKQKADVDDTSGPNNQQYTREDIITMLRECQKRNEKCTARTFASEDDFCSPETVQRHFGSWSDAKDEAGL